MTWWTAPGQSFRWKYLLQSLALRGIDQAVAVVSDRNSPLTPDEYVDLLLDELVGDRTDHDDIAVVVVHHQR